MKHLSILLFLSALAGAGGVAAAAVPPGATAQVGAPATDEEGLPIPSPPEESPPSPPDTPPPPPQDAQASPAPPGASGQWVYTQQYGWLWMAYGDAYAYVPPSGTGEPYAYVYYPFYAAWTWVAAPWIWGWGPWPYFGVYGPYHYAWYHHGWWRYPTHWHYAPAGVFHAGRPGYYAAHPAVPAHGIPPAPAFARGYAWGGAPPGRVGAGARPAPAHVGGGGHGAAHGGGGHH